jgi:hypothetical protein
MFEKRKGGGLAVSLSDAFSTEGSGSSRMETWKLVGGEIN